MNRILLLWLVSGPALAGGLFDDYDWPEEYFDSHIEKVNWEVNQQYLGESNACLVVAQEKQKLLGGKIVVIDQADGERHAVLVVDGLVLDNNYSDIFPIADTHIRTEDVLPGQRIVKQ